MLPTDPATNDDLRQLEALVDGRFRAVGARFVAVDGRFGQLGDRLNEIQQHLQRLASSSEDRCDAIDARLEATWAHLDQVRAQLHCQIDHARRDLGRMVLLGFVGMVVSTAGLCLGTIILSSL